MKLLKILQELKKTNKQNNKKTPFGVFYFIDHNIILNFYSYKFTSIQINFSDNILLLKLMKLQKAEYNSYI